MRRGQTPLFALPVALLVTLPALLVLLGLPATVSASVIGINVIARPLTRERIAALPKKDHKAWLDYLDRSEKQKQIDKQTLADEQKAAGNTSPKHATGGRRNVCAARGASCGVVDRRRSAQGGAQYCDLSSGGWRLEQEHRHGEQAASARRPVRRGQREPLPRHCGFR